MSRRILYLLFAFTLLSFTSVAAQGDDPTWSAWLYTGYGDLTRIGADGSVLQQVKMPYTSRTLNHEGTAISFSPSGRYIAFSGGGNRLTVMDSEAGTETQIEFGGDSFFNSFYVVREPRLFNQEETALAFGAGNSNYQTGMGTWEIGVYDITTGEKLHTLRDTDPVSQELELPGFNFVPLIQHFEDGRVSFILFPDGMESGPHYASYTWTLDTGELTPNARYTFRGFDWLPGTGEIIYPMADNRFPIYPCEGECGPYVHWNTLRVYDPSADTAYPFFSTPTLQIVGVEFIQNGKRVLALTHDLENFTYGTHVLAVIDRDGTLVSQHTVERLTAARGVTDGFIYTTDESNTVEYVDTRAGSTEAVPLWAAPTEIPVLLLWASQPTADADYQPWANLTPE